MLDKVFFEKYQRQLIRIFNNKLVRFVLRHTIFKHPLPERIDVIRPDGCDMVIDTFYSCRKCVKRFNNNPDAAKACMHIRKEQFKRVLGSYWTGPQFAKVIQRVLKWVPTFSFVKDWDEQWKFQPAFGLSTASYNPQAGSGGGNVTVDGALNGPEGVNWASTREGATAGSASTTATTIHLRIDQVVASDYRLFRGVFTFDTTSLNDESIINSVAGTNIKLERRGSENNSSSAENEKLVITKVALANANNIVVGDWDSYAGLTGPMVEQSDRVDWSALSNPGGIGTFTLNPNGIDNISKTAVTQFGVVFVYDSTDVDPGAIAEVNASCTSADDGVNPAPQLNLDFTVPAFSSNSHSIDLERDSNQYLSVADSASLSITGDMTVELWVKFESLPSSGSDYIFISKSDENGQRSFKFRQLNDGGTQKLRFDVTEDGTGANETTAEFNHTPTTGVWAHYACVYVSGGSPVAKFYKDGLLLSSASFGTPANANSIFDSTSALNIGAVNGVRYFDGLIDEVRIWSDQRTQTEIRQYMGYQLLGGEPNLRGHWSLNNSLLDSSGFSNDLTNNNSAVFSTDAPFTADTFFADPDPETTSVDGTVTRFPGCPGQSWSDIRNGAGTSSNDNGTNQAANLDACNSGLWRGVTSFVSLFDTSSIPDADTISSATYSVFGISKSTNVDNSLVITGSSPASNTALVSSDYNVSGTNFGTAAYSSTALASAFTLSVYNDYSLNATGISNISLTGVTKLGFTWEAVRANTTPNHPGSEQDATTVQFGTADNSGTSNDPKLVVIHAGAAPPSAEDVHQLMQAAAATGGF